MVDATFICGDPSLASLLWEDPNGGPYRLAFLFCNGVAFLTFAVSTLSGNLSQVDKLWSILPAIYALVCIVDDRTALMAALATLWSIRLTYNFYRRGGYAWPPWRGDEDYRWEVLRRGTLGGWWTLLQNKWVMMAFNVVFISLYQNFLLLYIASPSLVAWSAAVKGMHCPSEGDPAGAPPPLNILDGVACSLVLLFLAIEAVADKQQYTFQSKKREWNALASGGTFANAVKGATSQSSHKEFADGFYQSGLFAIVRKPNYAAEQAIWISFYLFSVAATYSGQLTFEKCLNWSSGGCVLLCILFQGSGWLTERITQSKYPAYSSYQRRVPLYVPTLSSLLRGISGSEKDK
ncbi:hypothetical protein ACHAXT_008758 [Thalassiosira profunda]